MTMSSVYPPIWSSNTPSSRVILDLSFDLFSCIFFPLPPYQLSLGHHLHLLQFPWLQLRGRVPCMLWLIYSDSISSQLCTACWMRLFQWRPLRAASRKTLIFCSYGADFIQNQTQEFQRKVKVQPSKISSALPCGSTAFLAIIVLTQAMKGKANVAECKLHMFPETWTLFPRLT